MNANSPFRIEGPAVISFSGGRTSAYLLRRVLDEGIRPDVHVLFENTGKEREETLRFVHEVGVRWGVPIRWLEYRRKWLPRYRSAERARAAAAARDAVGVAGVERPQGEREPGWAEVDFATASRSGEPFDNLIQLMGLPNQTTRLCTSELKIRVAKKWMMAQGYDHWTNVVGIRAD